MRSKPEVDPDVEVKEEVDDGSYNMALKVKLRHTKVPSKKTPEVKQVENSPSGVRAHRPRTSHKKEVQCLDCHTVWPDRLALSRHKKVCGKEDVTTDREGGGLTCGFCSSVWPDERSLKQHLCNCRLRLQQESTEKLLSGKSKQMQCNICYKYFFNETSYQTHCTTSHGQYPPSYQKHCTTSHGLRGKKEVKKTVKVHTEEEENDQEDEEEEEEDEDDMESDTDKSGEDDMEERSKKGPPKSNAQRQREYRARKRAARNAGKQGAASADEKSENKKKPKSSKKKSSAIKRKAPRTSPRQQAKRAKLDADETAASPVGGPTSSARSLSSQRNANASKQCMDCHEVLPNALALAQHKRKGCMDVSELLGTGPTTAKPRDGDSIAELQYGILDGDASGSGKNSGLVTCLDCGKKCNDFMKLHEHKKADCAKTYGDITIASKLSRPIHCLNCHEASFKTYLELHKHKINECPLTKLKSGPFECEHCTEQFDSMLKYSHHLSRCPIRQLLNVTDTSIESLTDTFTLAQDFGIDLSNIKQEIDDEPGGSDVIGEEHGGDDVTNDAGNESEDQNGVSKHKIGTKGQGRRSPRYRVKKTVTSEGKEDAAESKMEDDLGEIKIKEEKMDDEDNDEDENFSFGRTLMSEPEEYQCNFCGDGFSLVSEYDEHMESCPLRNTMATKDITIPLSSENNPDETLSVETRKSGRTGKKQQAFLKTMASEEEDYEDDDNDGDEAEIKTKSKTVKGKAKGKGKKTPTRSDTTGKRNAMYAGKKSASLLRVKFNLNKRKPVHYLEDEEDIAPSIEGEKWRIHQHDLGTATFAKAIKEGRKIFVLSKEQLEGNKTKSEGGRHAPITCLDCGFPARNRIQLENHKKSCNQVGSTKVFACFDCNNSFYTRGELNEHKKIAHGDAEYLEQTEKLIQQSMDARQQQTQTLHKKVDDYKCKHEYCYVCVTCSMRFPMKSDCQLHFIEKHPEELTEKSLSFSKEQCKRCGMLVKCRHTAVYLCHVCREKFSTQIGCKMHFYESHPVELGKQKLPIFTCIERCIKCHLEITVDVPDLAGRLGSEPIRKERSSTVTSKTVTPSTQVKISTSTSTLSSSSSLSSASNSRETPCENCMTAFPNVDAFLVHLPCSKTLNTGKSENIRVSKNEIGQTRPQTLSELNRTSDYYQCSICQAKFRSKLALLSHKPCFGLQNDDGKYFCLACQVLFPNELDYLKHKRTKHSLMGAPMTCWDCGESFKFYVDLSQHRLKYHGSGRKQVIPTDELQEDNISVVLVDKDKNIVEKVTKENIREVIDHKIKVPTNFTEYVGKTMTCTTATETKSSLKSDVHSASFGEKGELNARRKIADDIEATDATSDGDVTSTSKNAASRSSGRVASATKSKVTPPVTPLSGTIKLPPGMQLPQGLVMKQGPDGKLCIQTPGVTDYKVSMVTTPDGSFQLKFDKTGSAQAQQEKPQNGGQAAKVPAQPRLPQLTPRPGTSLLRAVQVPVANQNVACTPQQAVKKVVSGPVQVAQKQGLQIRSVGQIVNLPDGKRVYVPSNEKGAGDGKETQKSRPNILSRTNRRKSTPRKVMSKVTSPSSSVPQPIKIEPQDDITDQEPEVDVVYSFRCSGCEAVFSSSEAWQKHAELCRNWSREIHPIIEATTTTSTATTDSQSDDEDEAEEMNRPRLLGNVTNENEISRGETRLPLLGAIKTEPEDV